MFVRRGTAGARMQEIAAEAGVNQALLHYYFRSKEQLARAAFERAGSQLMPAIVRVMASDAAIEDKVRRVVAIELDHLSRACEMAAGEREVAPKKLPTRFFPLKQLFIYVLPFPKGLPTSPELLNDSPEPLDQSKATLRRIITTFDPKPCDHPAFGMMSPHAWSVLVYRHADHHLRQFGA